MTLTRELRRIQDEAHEAAVEFGLDFPEVIFELVDSDQLNMIAAYGGFPVRYPHWRFGMEYQQLQKSYEYGLSKIYELVINTDPCYAYLMKTNGLMEQKLVMAHVYGHADFFRNNAWFEPTDRRMIDTMANHATRVRRHVDRQGPDKVERFIDACLSLENLIDPMSLYIKRHGPEEKLPEMDEKRLAAERVHRFPVEHAYMERYINPRDEVAAKEQVLAEQLEKRRRVPAHPERDVLGFVLQNAPLADWQADVLSIIRTEAYYFAPQRMTKILNEGWASFCHSTLMSTRLVESSEVVNYCDKHAGTLSTRPGQINPYRLGFDLLHDVEDRWNTGRHGKAWNDCEDRREKRNWDTGARDGRRKLFEVRRIHNDQTFLDAFLTPEFIEDNQLYIYGRDPQTGQTVIMDKDPVTVKPKLLAQLTNMGQPIIDVVDANHANRKELWLVHRADGTGLREDFARDTLKSLHTLWSRPVHIQTEVEGKRVVWSFDGKSAETSELDPARA